jgi:hypothetical protein
MTSAHLHHAFTVRFHDINHCTLADATSCLFETATTAIHPAHARARARSALPQLLRAQTDRTQGGGSSSEALDESAAMPDGGCVPLPNNLVLLPANSRLAQTGAHLPSQMATLRPTGKVSTNHKACIHHIAHDYYGKRVATCSSDKVRAPCPALRTCSVALPLAAPGLRGLACAAPGGPGLGADVAPQSFCAGRLPARACSRPRRTVNVACSALFLRRASRYSKRMMMGTGILFASPLGTQVRRA